MCDSVTSPNMKFQSDIISSCGARLLFCPPCRKQHMVQKKETKTAKMETNQMENKPTTVETRVLRDHIYLLSSCGAKQRGCNCFRVCLLEKRSGVYNNWVGGVGLILQSHHAANRVVFMSFCTSSFQLLWQMSSHAATTWYWCLRIPVLNVDFCGKEVCMSFVHIDTHQQVNLVLNVYILWQVWM